MTDPFDLVIANGTLVSGGRGDGDGGGRRADVGISGERFAAIEEPGALEGRGRDTIDARGLHVLPGLIDSHVHFREPGLEYKEDWLTGSRAAVMGGITTVLDMPNTVPPTADVAAAEAKMTLAGARSYCDFGLFGLLGADNAALSALAKSGLVIGFKVFLGPTTGALDAPPPEALAAAMTAAAGAGLRLAAHCEDRSIIEREEARLRRAGRSDPLAHLESRPAEAEAEAIRMFGRLARNTGCPVHVLHLSSADGLEAVTLERAAGAAMTCEVSAHHCFLSADDYPRLGGLVKCNPPIREARHAKALLDALADGRIEMVASDHAPHAPREKSASDIWRVAAGIGGVETTLPLLLTCGVNAGRLTLERLVAAMAEAPARTWGLWPRKGVVAVGSDADVTIVDLHREGRIEAGGLHGKHAVTPFDGWPTHGAPVTTIVRGRVVVRDGRLVGEPGWGRLVAREAA